MKKQFFLSFFLLSLFSFSQENSSDNSIVPTVKIYYLNQTKRVYSKEQIVNFLNDSTNYELLNSKGFDTTYVFIKIKQRGNFHKVLKREPSDSDFINNKVPMSCDFIIAFNKLTKRFYRLKGFEKNDFKLFFNDCNIQSKKSMVNFYEIEELNLTCLFNYYFLNKKNCYIECIRSCTERDDSILKLRLE